MTSATGNRGFTLLELLIVLTILVLMAAAWPLAAPRVFPAQQLRNEGQRLLAALRSARMTARLTGLPQHVQFQSSMDAYSMGAEAHPLARGITAQVRDQSNSSVSVIRFFPDGSSTGGTVDLLLSSRSFKIEIGAVTGRAETGE